VAVFATLFLAAGTGPVTQTNLSSVRYIISVAGGLAIAAVVGAAVYPLAVRPFSKSRSPLGWIGAVVALAFALRGGLGSVFTRSSYVFPDPFPFSKLGHQGTILIGDASLQVRTFFVIAVGLGLAFLTARVLNSSRFGRGLRALAQDREGAQLAGVPVDRYLALAFAMAGVLAAVAAIMAAPGALLGLKGLVAAMLGRFILPGRVFVAGLALGVFEALVGSFHIGPIALGPEYRDVLPLAVALALLMVVKVDPRTEQVA
jgi:branched-chain amino acid transport system permease protein